MPKYKHRDIHFVMIKINIF